MINLSTYDKGASLFTYKMCHAAYAEYALALAIIDLRNVSDDIWHGPSRYFLSRIGMNVHRRSARPLVVDSAEIMIDGRGRMNPFASYVVFPAPCAFGCPVYYGVWPL